MSNIAKTSNGIERFNPIRQRFIEQVNEKTFNREASFALQLLQTNKSLQKCTEKSLLASVLNISHIGLSLNPASKLAYIVPRYTNGEMRACLEPSYQGLVKLITDTGSCTSVQANVVYKGDDFDYSLGLNPDIKHKPKFESKEIIGCYAWARLKDGTHQIEFMTIDELHSIRDVSESYKAYKAKKIKSCVWVDWESEMCRKTVIRRLVKYLPKTEQFDRVAEAISLYESDYQASIGQLSIIESLLDYALIPDEEKSMIEDNLHTMSPAKASEMIAYLKENQPPKEHVGNMSQTEISEVVQNKVDDPRA